MAEAAQQGADEIGHPMLQLLAHLWLASMPVLGGGEWGRCLAC